MSSHPWAGAGRARPCVSRVAPNPGARRRTAVIIVARNVAGSRSSSPSRSQTGVRSTASSAVTSPSVSSVPGGATNTVTPPVTASSNRECAVAGSDPIGSSTLPASMHPPCARPCRHQRTTEHHPYHRSTGKWCDHRQSCAQRDRIRHLRRRRRTATQRAATPRARPRPREGSARAPAPRTDSTRVPCVRSSRPAAETSAPPAHDTAD